MGRALRTVAERQSAALVATAFALLVVLLPSLPLTSTAESGALTLALVTLALAALVRLDLRSIALAGAGGSGTTCPTRDDTPTAPAGRVTDPAHHPLRPRAPGTA